MEFDVLRRDRKTGVLEEPDACILSEAAGFPTRLFVCVYVFTLRNASASALNCTLLSDQKVHKFV